VPGEKNKSVDLLLNNTGNTLFSNINITGRNLLQQPSGTNLISAPNFSISSTSSLSCAETILEHGVQKQAVGASLPSGNNSKNTEDANSGQEEIFICLREVPIIAAAEYRAGGANTWEITTIPPHTFI